MLTVPLFRRVLSAVATSATVFLALGTVSTTPAAAALFDFNYEGTLTGIDPLGTAVTFQKVNGNFVLDADIPNTSPTPIAGQYEGAIRDLNLTFASTFQSNTVNFNTTNFPGTVNRLYIGPLGKTEELQFLFGNVAEKPPFFQAPSFGIIFDSNDLTPTTNLKELLIPSNGKVDGQFKLTLKTSQADDPNNLFSGSFTITRVPEPGNIAALILLSLGFIVKRHRYHRERS